MTSHPTMLDALAAIRFQELGLRPDQIPCVRLFRELFFTHHQCLCVRSKMVRGQRVAICHCWLKEKP